MVTMTLSKLVFLLGTQCYLTSATSARRDDSCDSSGETSGDGVDFGDIPTTIYPDVPDHLCANELNKAIDVLDNKIKGYENFLDDFKSHAEENIRSFIINHAEKVYENQVRTGVLLTNPVGKETYVFEPVSKVEAQETMETIEELVELMVLGLKDLKKKTKKEDSEKFEEHYDGEENVVEKKVLLDQYKKCLNTKAEELAKLPKMGGDFNNNLASFLGLINPIKDLTIDFVHCLNEGFTQHKDGLTQLVEDSKNLKTLGKSEQSDKLSEMMHFLQKHQGYDATKKEQGSLYQICQLIKQVAGVKKCSIRPVPKKASRMITKMIQKYDMHAKEVSDSFGCEIITESVEEQIRVLNQLFNTFGKNPHKCLGDAWEVSIQKVKLNLSKIAVEDDVDQLRIGYADDKIIFHVKHIETNEYLRVEAIIMCEHVKNLKPRSHKHYDVIREAGNLVKQELNLIMAKHVQEVGRKHLSKNYNIKRNIGAIKHNRRHHRLSAVLLSLKKDAKAAVRLASDVWDERNFYDFINVAFDEMKQQITKKHDLDDDDEEPDSLGKLMNSTTLRELWTAQAQPKYGME